MGRVKGVVASVEVEKAGRRDGGQNGEVDGTISGDNADSNRVEVAWLAAKGQYTHNNATQRRNDLPVSPEPPTRPPIPMGSLVTERESQGEC